MHWLSVILNIAVINNIITTGNKKSIKDIVTIINKVAIKVIYNKDILYYR